MNRSTAGLFLVACVAWLVACSRNDTGLVVRLESDMTVPTELSHARVRIVRVPERSTDSPFDVPIDFRASGAAPLPNEVLVTPRDANDTRSLSVTVTANDGDAQGLAQPVVTAVLPFVPGHYVRVVTFLALACGSETVRAACAAQGLQCGRGGVCEAGAVVEIVDPRTGLVTGTAGDAGVVVPADVGVPPAMEAGADVVVPPGMDGGVDAVVPPAMEAGFDVVVPPAMEAGADVVVVPGMEAGADAISRDAPDVAEACVPQCTGRVCGPDQCGGTCGAGCATGQMCSASGTCFACSEGAVCLLATACRTGRVTCSGGAMTCMPSGNVERGMACAVGRSCDGAGDCVTCSALGEPCCAGSCGAGLECNAGTCGCASGQTACGGVCVDPFVDVNNCGGCGTVCPVPTGGSTVCYPFDGVIPLCHPTCPSGRTVCGNACVDIANDVNNCGACGTACGAGRACSSYSCRTASTTRPSCPSTTERGCEGLVEVPGGTFTMGGDGTAYDAINGSTGASITVGPYALDASEVTVARFRRWWTGANHAAPTGPIAYPGGNTLTWSYAVTAPADPSVDPLCNWSTSAGGRELHPINCVDWYTAEAFCAWDGGRLPTEAEWEFAARGWSDGRPAPRAFPWGDPEPSTTCDRARWNPTSCAGDDGAWTKRVDSYAATGGLYDLAGNVWEWAADGYAGGTDVSCWGSASRTNSVCNINTTGTRVIRGGSWNSGGVAELRSASRFGNTPTVRNYDLGFRCARTR